MIGAVITAVYDYETDWRATSDPEHSLTFQLLENYISDNEARQNAQTLFLADHTGKLSGEGLERGSIALGFYNAIIASDWMKEYGNGQINQFGQKLQIVDDLLDFKKDKRERAKNCFLSGNREVRCREARAFLQSDFYSQLERNSLVYRGIKFKCQQVLNELEGTSPTRKQLFREERWLTGVFTGLLVFASFRFYHPILYLLALITALDFLGITISIMIFNDLIDRNHDVKKGRTFALEHTWLLLIRWLKLTMFTLVGVLGIALLDSRVALLMVSVWLVGFLYSFARSWYVGQNLIVATCVASPVLCGMVHFGEFQIRPILIFLAIFFSILMREIVKDILDQEYDQGYKVTIPVRQGRAGAVVMLFVLCIVPCIFLVLYPSLLVKCTAYLYCIVQGIYGLMLIPPVPPSRSLTAIKVISLFLAALVVAVLIAP